MEKCNTVAKPGVAGRRHGSDAELARCFSEQPSEPSARPPVANEPLRMSSFVTPLQSVRSSTFWTQMWCGSRGAPRGRDARHLLDQHLPRHKASAHAQSAYCAGVHPSLFHGLISMVIDGAMTFVMIFQTVWKSRQS